MIKFASPFEKIAEDEENIVRIDSTWCINRSGILLSYAVPVQVLSITELSEFGDDFVKAVKDSYKDLLKLFVPKSDTPLIAATSGGEIIMLWSFQGQESDGIKNELKKYKIKQINYD